MTLPDDEYGTPDEENPEWTDEDFLWAVWAKDFGSYEASVAFLIERQKFLNSVKAAGLPREAFLSLKPTKLGFVERATQVLENALSSAKHGAE